MGANEQGKYPKGKELREVDLYERTLEDIEAEFRGSDWRNVDAALESVNAELEQYGLEVVMGNAPDTNVWVKVEPIREEETNEVSNDAGSEEP